jgi:hypothetical protein
VAAARLANAHEFISALPDGYKTEIGDYSGAAAAAAAAAGGGGGVALFLNVCPGDEGVGLTSDQVRSPQPRHSLCPHLSGSFFFCRAVAALPHQHSARCSQGECAASADHDCFSRSIILEPFQENHAVFLFW